jgi:hypothetical protein
MAQYASNVLFSIDTALQLKNGLNIETLTAATKDLTYQDSTFQVLEAHASGDLKLPLPKSGTFFFICNTSGGNVLAVKLQSGTVVINLVANNAGTPAASTCLCFSDGTDWKAQVFTSHTV